jgi:hypothetical protein
MTPGVRRKRGDSMKARILWSKILVIAGLIAMVVGALDPIEGSLIILPGCGISALSALLSKSPHRRLLYCAFVFIAIGVGLMFALSMFGGVGGNSGHSAWCGLVVLPYPIGWIMGLLGSIRRLTESFKERAQGNCESAPGD